MKWTTINRVFNLQKQSKQYRNYGSWDTCKCLLSFTCIHKLNVIYYVTRDNDDKIVFEMFKGKRMVGDPMSV